jgi:O-antigen ligase
VLALLVAGARRRIAPPPPLPRSIAIAGGAWILLCLASVAWSTNVRYSLGELKPELGYGMLAFAVFYAGTRTPRDAHRAIAAALAGALLLALFEWIRAFFSGLYYAPRYEAVRGYYSTHLVLVAPLLVLVAWPRPVGLGAGRTVLALLAAGLLAGGLAAENRMLWLALGVGTLVAFAAYRRLARPAALPAGLRVAFLLLLAIIALLVALSAELKAQRHYPHGTGPLAALALDQRPGIWATAVKAIAERPWLGHGFGRGIVADEIVQATRLRGAEQDFRHAHNIVLDVALQLGLAGTAAFVALLAAIALELARAARVPASAPAGIAGLAMLAAFLAKNMTDDFFYRPNSLVFWALAGLLLRIAKPGTQSEFT